MPRLDPADPTSIAKLQGYNFAKSGQGDVDDNPYDLGSQTQLNQAWWDGFMEAIYEQW